MKWIDWIYKEYSPGYTLYNGDSTAIALFVIANSLIGICFIIIGITALHYSRHAHVEPGGKERRLFVELMGLFLITCGSSQIVAVLCLWHNLAYLNIFLRLATGFIALLTLLYLPRMIKAVAEIKVMNDLAQQLKKTAEKVDKLRETTDKLAGGTK